MNGNDVQKVRHLWTQMECKRTDGEFRGRICLSTLREHLETVAARRNKAITAAAVTIGICLGVAVGYLLCVYAIPFRAGLRIGVECIIAPFISLATAVVIRTMLLKLTYFIEYRKWLKTERRRKVAKWWKQRP